MELPRRGLTAALVLAAGTAWAQDAGTLEPDPYAAAALGACQASMADAGFTIDQADACDELRVFLFDGYLGDARRIAKANPTQVDVAPKPDLGRGGVETLQPSPAAGATAAVAGTNSGARVLTEIRLNPLSLLSMGSTDEAKARTARSLDVTVILPISTDQGIAGLSGLGAIDYVGLRLRFNALGSTTAARLLKETADIFAAKSTYEDKTLDVALDRMLRKHATDPECMTALMRRDAALQEKHCREAVTDDITKTLVEYSQQLRAGVEALREELDRRYLGVEVKADFGDPTLSGDPAKRGTTLVASAAGGQSTSDEAKTRFVQARLRAGLAYSFSQATRETNFSLDWGAGVDISTQLDGKSLRIGLGFEGRHFGTLAGGETNYVDFHLSVGVPLSDGSSLAVTASLPAVQPAGGTRKPMLNVSGNWELLVPVLKGI